MADFTPSVVTPNLQGYTGQEPFRFWCQMALPIVYDDTLSYYELLNKVVVYLNNTISDVATAEANIQAINDATNTNIAALLQSYRQLQGYVNDYFTNLDVQQEINNKLDAMATSGELSNLLSPFIPDLVTNWLNNNVDPVGSAVVVDSSLTVAGAAADAKKTGTMLDNVKSIGDETANALFDNFSGDALTPIQTNTGYWLSAIGGGQQIAESAGYEILRFAVTADTTLFIRSGTSNESPCKWVFKSSNSGASTNNVGSTHLINGAWIVNVPTGATHLFMARLINDTSTNVYKTGFGDGHILNPCVFMFISGDKLRIVCTSTARAMLDDNVLNISTWSTSFDYNHNNTQVVVMTRTGFLLKNAPAVKWGDCIVAYCYGASYTVVGIDKNVICNTIPLDNFHKRANVPFFVNKRKIPRVNICTYLNHTHVADFGYFYRIDNAINQNPLRYVTPDGFPMANATPMLLNSTDISNKKILCIGDSITRRGWFQEQIKTHVNSVEFLGTQTSYYGENGNAGDGKYYCEGYSGRTAKNVLDSSTILLQDNVTYITNPFYNPTTGKCELSYYCSNTGNVPDYVIIEFGLNETDARQYSTVMQAFINTCYSYNPNIVVYVVQPFSAVNGDIGSANCNSEFQENQTFFCVVESYTFEHCVKIPCWYIMVDEYDYPISMATYGYDNITVPQFSDGVHPGVITDKWTGFKKLGDQIYNYLGLTS